MRQLPAALIEHYKSATPNLIFLVELHWSSGIIRAHSGIGELSIGGKVYSGVGNLGNLGAVKDDDELGRSELTVELSGFDADLLRESLRRDAVGRSGMVYAAVRDAQGMPIESSLTPLYAGFIADVSSSLGDSSAISVTIATDSADPRRKRPARYTDESHRREYPQDHFYRWSAKTADRAIYWGGKRNAVSYK